MGADPFDGLPGTGRPKNPFGDETEEERAMDGADAAGTIEHASARIRRLKQQIGAEGLSLSATRELIDQVTRALDATAAALRNR